MECTAEGLHSSGSFTTFSAPIRFFLFEVCWLSLIIPLVNFSVTSLCTALTHLAYQRVSCDEVFMLIWAEGWASATCQNLLGVTLIRTEGWACTSCQSLLDISQKARSLPPPSSTLTFHYFLLLGLEPCHVKPSGGLFPASPGNWDLERNPFGLWKVSWSDFFCYVISSSLGAVMAPVGIRALHF